MTDSWYYIRDQRKVGPVAIGELGKLTSSGQLHGTDMILQQGSKKWVPASTVQGLKFAAGTTPTAATPAPGINSTPEGTSRLQPFLLKWNRWIIGSASGLVAILVVSMLIGGRRERDPVGNVPNATQETPKPEDPAQLPSGPHPVAQKAPAPDEPAKKEESAANKDKSVVVAEGVGTTGDAALKDAFRKAVRQVVGAVVDAETLVKDDQIISDKVLTYSDGFVKSYEEISTSQDMGFFRTKINATVERRSLIAKLKAANVAVKDVDGKGIFAEVVTDLEAAKNAKELMEKAMEGFPLNVLEAKAIGKPDIIDRTAENVRLSIRVAFRPNAKTYDTFITKLRTTLEAIARERAELVTRDGFEPPYKAKSGQIAVAIWKSVQKNEDSWDLFAVDESVRPLLVALCSHEIMLKVSLLGENGNVIAAKTLRPASVGDRHPVYRSFFGRHNYLMTCMDKKPHPGDPRPQKVSLFLIGPFIFERPYGDDGLAFRRHQDRERLLQFTLSLNEVKAVKSVKCDLAN